ncbi:hypothetical protein ANN_18956 [Periplaneta americana]|uniref:Uncharacterized protein n=1 Tax=Periplaneta americana TaxID=6978 RepID=A0ABQ8SRH8_PERAM|nr:hypothetical protein ANN_18956 [Periplaneta americana]
MIVLVRTPENVERVRQAILRSPRRSARRHSAALGISNRTVKVDAHWHEPTGTEIYSSPSSAEALTLTARNIPVPVDRPPGTGLANGPSFRREGVPHHIPVVTVIVHKDENGYGMKVSGDNPVYVQSVKEGECPLPVRRQMKDKEKAGKEDKVERRYGSTRKGSTDNEKRTESWEANV